MKNILTYFILIVAIEGFSQCGNNSSINTIDCINSGQLYTKTTDPDDATTYAYTANSLNYNLNPNSISGPTHFNWMTANVFTVTTGIINNIAHTYQINSPFFPSGGSPFYGGQGNYNIMPYQNISSLQNITQQEKLKRMDILASDGWELLKYNFGTAVNPQEKPYFVLYNRYTGKLKYFVCITSDTQGQLNQFNNAIIRAYTNPAGQYDLFANAKPFTHIFSDFNHTQILNELMPNSASIRRK